MPLDILVPFWGDPALLRDTVASVRAQTTDEWRLTVVDDAYPDESVAAWFDTLDDPRITYVRNETNIGIVANFRRCVALATQERMVLLGCDDLLHPNYVAVVLAAHGATPDAAIIQPGVDVIDQAGRPAKSLADAVKARMAGPRPTRKVLSGEALAVSLLRGNWLYWPSLAFRLDVIRQYDFRDEFPIVLDLAIIMDMVFDGHSLVVDPTVCFSYRRHTASLSSSALAEGSRFREDRQYFSQAAAQARRRGWLRANRAARYRLTTRAHALSLLPRSIFRGHWKAAGALITHVVQRDRASGPSGG